MNEIIGIISTLLSLVLGSGGVYLWRENKRLKKAEATHVETNNAILAGNEWRDIAEKRETKLDDKDAKIDTLYLDISSWRDKFNAAISESHKLKLKLQSAEYRACAIRGCKERDPKTGY